MTEAKNAPLAVAYWAIDRLVPYARNARTHSPQQVAEIAGSIRCFGFTNPILASPDGDVIAGHGRLAPAIPDCPEELGPVARKEWDRLTSELAGLRMLTSLDRNALAAYCGVYALWAEAMAAIQRHRTLVEAPSGYPIQSPYVAIADRQAEFMMRLASEFGFTPASRARLSVPNDGQRGLIDEAEERD